MNATNCERVCLGAYWPDQQPPELDLPRLLTVVALICAGAVALGLVWCSAARSARARGAAQRHAGFGPGGAGEEDAGGGGPEAVSLPGLFRFATGLDVVLMVAGTLCSVASGLVWPAFYVLLGSVIDDFVYSGRCHATQPPPHREGVHTRTRSTACKLSSAAAAASTSSASSITTTSAASSSPPFSPPLPLLPTIGVAHRHRCRRRAAENPVQDPPKSRA